MGNYRELAVWQQSVTLAVDTYQVCEQLPSNEQYGLQSQMQRAAVSVAANIAEG